jgi:hypothetical protein
MIDMRMPCTFGHSRAVASLSVAAANQMGLPASDLRDVWPHHDTSDTKSTTPDIRTIPMRDRVASATAYTSKLS